MQVRTQFEGRFRLLFLLWLLLALAFVVALVQHVGGWPLMKTEQLDLREKTSVRGQGLRVLLPARYRSAEVAERLTVLEDGKPLPIRASAVKQVVKLGYGRYRATPGYVYLSASDNSPPRENGKTYSIRVPQSVRPVVLWGLLAAVVIVGGFALRGLPRPRFETWPDTRIALLLAGLSVVVSIAAYACHDDRSESFMLIKGVPFSDASGWTELAHSLEDGRGFTCAFQGHRPFYPIFMGAVYSVFGQSLCGAKITNIVLFAMATGFAYLFGARQWSRLVGLALAGWILCDPAVHVSVHYTLTENLAFALGVPAFYFLAEAFRSGSRSAFFVGLLLAASNLSRPFTMLATLLFGLIFLARLLRKTDPWPLRDVLVRGGVFSAAILIVFVPWCVRQKIVNGTFSPSANSSVLMYAGAAPGVGHSDAWNSEHVREAERAGIDVEDVRATTAFYSQRYRETVDADRGAYLRRLLGFVPGFFEGFPMNTLSRRAFFAALAAVFLLFEARRRSDFRPLLLLPVAVLAVPWILEVKMPILLPACAAVVLLSPWCRERKLGSQLGACALAGACVLSVLVANFALNRGEIILSWLACYLVATALLHGLGALVRLITRTSRAESSSEVTPLWNPFSKITMAALGGVCLLGFGIMGVKNLIGYDGTPALPMPDRFEQDAARFPVLRERPANYVSAIIEIGDYRIPLAANEDIGNCSPVFAPEPFPRIVLFPRHADGRLEGILMPPVIFTGNLDSVPAEGVFLLTGLTRTDAQGENARIEAISLTPFDLESGGVDRSGAIDFEPVIDRAPAEKGEKESPQ